MSVSLILSMPSQTDPLKLRDAARDFAGATFGGRFDYVLALHTDTDHPHVHLGVRALGYAGERLNPRKPDLAAWRQRFAAALRDRCVEAEATPRRARGVVRKAERMAPRRLRERQANGQGAASAVERAAVLEAVRDHAGRAPAARPWETAIAERQSRLRGTYLAQAAVLFRSGDPGDHALAEAVRRFVQEMPAVETRLMELGRQLARRDPSGRDKPVKGRSR